MSEAESIAAVTAPNTVATLAADLRALGLMPGMTVLVHSSLSALGWVCGGPVAVIQALEQVLTADGTLIMPTHSGGLSDPSLWSRPPVPESWWPIIRDTMPVFDPAFTPTRGMGSIAEAFRTQPGVRRSDHPQVSFAAWGKDKTRITDGHSWDEPLGPLGPLGRTRDQGGRILLMGVGHDRNTSLHLAETLALWPGKTDIAEPAPWKQVKGKTLWKPVKSVAYQGEDFPAIGTAFEAASGSRSGRVGQAECRLLDQNLLVAFAVDWMEKHRFSPAGGC